MMELIAVATFGGGCFWCMQPPYDRVLGVLKTTVGYMGGTVPSPSYQQVSMGRTGHVEVVQIEYNPNQVTYDQLLTIYWQNIDPTDQYGQFADLGPQYQPVIFAHSEAQRVAAEQSKATLAASKKFKKPIVVTVKLASRFYPAEGYHQRYYQTQPDRYNRYKNGSGRAGFLTQHWGKL